jgi:hypothetical protein
VIFLEQRHSIFRFSFRHLSLLLHEWLLNDAGRHQFRRQAYGHRTEMEERGGLEGPGLSDFDCKRILSRDRRLAWAGRAQMEGVGDMHWHGDIRVGHGRAFCVAPARPQGYPAGSARPAAKVGLVHVLVGLELVRAPAGLGFMKLGKLLMQGPHSRIRRLFSHLPALRRTLKMEGAIILRAHRKTSFIGRRRAPSAVTRCPTGPASRVRRLS